MCVLTDKTAVLLRSNHDHFSTCSTFAANELKYSLTALHYALNITQQAAFFLAYSAWHIARRWHSRRTEIHAWIALEGAIVNRTNRHSRPFQSFQSRSIASSTWHPICVCVFVQQVFIHRIVCGSNNLTRHNILSFESSNGGTDAIDCRYFFAVACMPSIARPSPSSFPFSNDSTFLFICGNDEPRWTELSIVNATDNSNEQKSTKPTRIQRSVKANTFAYHTEYYNLIDQHIRIVSFNSICHFRFAQAFVC